MFCKETTNKAKNAVLVEQNRANFVEVERLYRGQMQAIKRIEQDKRAKQGRICLLLEQNNSQSKRGNQ